jgi:CheY-like chemotaxis protein
MLHWWLQRDKALAIVRGHTLDCLVIDVMLSGHDGWEIIQRIRAKP